MKVLCLCAGGNVRSVTMAHILKERGHDALAASLSFNAPETLRLLCAWAEKVIIVGEATLRSGLPGECQPKTVLHDVGPDRWGVPFHPELRSLCEQFAL